MWFYQYYFFKPREYSCAGQIKQRINKRSLIVHCIPQNYTDRIAPGIDEYLRFTEKYILFFRTQFLKWFDKIKAYVNIDLILCLILYERKASKFWQTRQNEISRIVECPQQMKCSSSCFWAPRRISRAQIALPRKTSRILRLSVVRISFFPRNQISWSYDEGRFPIRSCEHVPTEKSTGAECRGATRFSARNSNLDRHQFDTIQPRMRRVKWKSSGFFSLIDLFLIPASVGTIFSTIEDVNNEWNASKSLKIMRNALKNLSNHLCFACKLRY